MAVLLDLDERLCAALLVYYGQSSLFLIDLR